MRRPPSLTLRLTLLFGTAAVVVFSVFGWFIEDSINRHFVAEDVSELEVVAGAVSKVLFTDLPKDGLASFERRFDDILVGHHGASLHIMDPGGRTIFASAGPDMSELAVSARNAVEDSVRSWSDGRHTFRVLTRHLRDKTPSTGRAYRIAVAVPIDYHKRFLDRFRYTLWLMIASGIAITSLMGWIAVRQGHAPLHNIVDRIRRISANELNTRLSPDTVPRELTDLAVSFNEMLGRMEEAFLRLSNFSADIAHELRTPVTSLMTQTQVALSQIRSSDEYREVLYSNIEEYERMAQMIGDMLYLAQADNGLCKPNNAEVDLAGEVRAFFDYYEAWAEECGVKLTFEGDAQASGDRLMLRRALNNLLANAIRHTPAGGTVWIRLDQLKNGEAQIDVKNSGSDIASEHLKKLFDRFYRVDPSRQEFGAGLGLAIVKSIVDAHGGKIAVTSAGGIAQFRIILPNPPGSAS
jgi:two-component system, OmpR family, heavy metal sensor histidine kinase CusS